MQFAHRKPYDTPDGQPPLDEQLRLHLSRHLVTLSCRGEWLKDGKVIQRGDIIVTGFTTDIAGEQCWVTAAHCLKELDREIAAGCLRLLDSGFADYHGIDAKHFQTYPFTYSPGCGQLVEVRSAGIDFGYIPLDPLMVQAFEKNGVLPVTIDNILGGEKADFIEFGLIGVPCCLTSQVNDSTVDYYPTKIPLHYIPTSTVPEALSEAFLAFKLDDSCDLISVEGMSGGPIYGMRKVGNQFIYNIVGIQSSWVKDTRIVLATNLAYLFRLTQDIDRSRRVEK